ncbi:hypothetical protein [Streptomyces capparidis]
MTTHSAGVVLVSAWVPELGDNRLDWHPCPDLPSPVGEERITTCTDMGAVLRAQGALVARLLARIGHYDGFRLLARARLSGDLAGSSEWYLSPETGIYLPYPEGVWSACDYGQHCHGQDDDEELAATLAA